MIVRRLGKSDLNILKKLRLNSLKLDPDNFASDYEDWVAKSDDEWRAYLDEPVFAAFVEEDAVGLIGLIPQTKSRMAHRAGVGMVWVEPSARGSGVSDALMTAVLDEARRSGLLQIELSVNAENARAVAFYEKHAFSVFGRLPRGFRTSVGFVDDLLMVRKLDS